MRLLLPLLVSPCLLVSCIPERNRVESTPTSPPTPAPTPTLQQPTQQPYQNRTTNASGELVQGRLLNQGERITRLETELHEMRLLFTNQLKRIEEVANRPAQLPASAYQQGQQQPQQVVIMPNSPVVTHRWDQQNKQQQATAANYQRAYRIQGGDTLSQIAQAHGVPTSSLLTANPGVDPLRLQIGRQLTIPSASQVNQLAAGGQSSRNPQYRSRSTYTVKAGDTFSQIAERFGLGLSQVVAANPGVNPSRLQIGKKLIIPGAAPAQQTQPTSTAPPTGYASPPLQSIQREPQQQPQPVLNPQYNSAPTRMDPNLPLAKKLIKVKSRMSFGEIAEAWGTDVDTLNRLNVCSLSATTPIPTNGTLYVPDYK